MTSQEEFLFGAGQAVRFENIGDGVSGIVLTEPKTATQTYQGQVRTWPSGEVMEQLIIRLLTQQRTDADDSGVRVLYVDSRFKKDALREALKLVGAKKVEVGGFIEMVHTEMGGENGTGKVVAAQYQKPTPQTLAIVEQHHAAGQTQPQQRVVQQPPQPATQPNYGQPQGQPPWPQQQPAQQSQPQWGPPPQPVQGFPQHPAYPQPQPVYSPPPQPQAQQAPVPPPQPPQAQPSWTPEIIAAIYANNQDPRSIYADYDGRYDSIAGR